MISIIIVNYNLAEEIANCINSLLQIKSETEFEIIVVDNNSTEVASRELAEKFKSIERTKLRFEFNSINSGFGSGNNLGVKYSTGELIFLLNPDTYLENNIFDIVQSKFSHNPDIAVMGPRVNKRNGEQEISVGKFPNLISELLEILQLKSLYSNYYYKYLTSNSQKILDVDWVTGSAFFVRRTIFNDIGGFDTNFFMYSEEVDLCRRIKSKSRRIVFSKDIGVVHLGSITSKKNYYFFTKTSYESKIYYIKKYFKGLKKLLMLKFLFLNLSIQLILWTILFPVSFTKAKGKLQAIPGLLIKVFTPQGSNANLY